MITLYGTGVCKGVGIAEAVVISDDGSLNSFPTEILQKGIQAIRRGEPASEMPAVAIICRSLESGTGLKLPGLRIDAVAAESTEGYADGCESPSVAGIDDLMRSVSSGDMVIVDGTRGIVYVDPHAEIIMNYQSMDSHDKTRRVFLESAHLPAVMQDGRMILVLAIIAQPSDVDSALSEGADSLLLTQSAIYAMTNEDWTRLLNDCGGKHLILMSSPTSSALRILVASALPLQVTIAAPASDPNELLAIQETISQVFNQLISDDIEPAEIDFAIISDPNNPFDGHKAVSVARIVVDARVCDAAISQKDLANCITTTLSDATSNEDERPAALVIPSTVILESSIDAVRYLAYGVDSVAVPPGLVSATKDLIRSIPAAD